MSIEGQKREQKSLRYVQDQHSNCKDLAHDCVAFANARGGTILVGIEDGCREPPAAQRIADALCVQVHKRLSQNTVNLTTEVRKRTGANGGEFMEIEVFPSLQSIASTTHGRYFLRVSDETRPLLPDDLGRLLSDKNSFMWELQTTLAVPREAADPVKRSDLLRRLRSSERVSAFLKSKSDQELLEHYQLVRSGVLTNLGILWVGRQGDRAALVCAPEIQCIKYDEHERKINKLVWNDHTRNPLELIEAVWEEVPDWREFYEIPGGLFRKRVPHYDEVVVRELLANALVHRPYTQRGDIFLNLYPDRLEVHNPGLLPVGVTPRNILHTTSKRNPHLARIFYDLKLMEGEGSGFDRMYQVLLASGRPAPEVVEEYDRVRVTVQRRLLRPALVDFMTRADQTYQLSQKELITLGMLAWHTVMTASELVAALELPQAEALIHWIGRLKKLGLVGTRGRTRGLQYFVDPAVLRSLEFGGETSLRGIERHRLRALILQDLEIYREASVSQIHQRIGLEIPRRQVRRELADLVASGELATSGETRGKVYHLTGQSSNQ